MGPLTVLEEGCLLHADPEAVEELAGGGSATPRLRLCHIPKAHMSDTETIGKHHTQAARCHAAGEDRLELRVWA